MFWVLHFQSPLLLFGSVHFFSFHVIGIGGNLKFLFSNELLDLGHYIGKFSHHSAVKPEIKPDRSITQMIPYLVPAERAGAAGAAAEQGRRRGGGGLALVEVAAGPRGREARRGKQRSRSLKGGEFKNVYRVTSPV